MRQKTFPTALLIIALAAQFGRAAEIPQKKQIEAIFSSLAEGRSPGVAVLVRQNGRTIFQRGYGVRDLRTRHKIDARTNFRLASFTKQFTAMAVMLLVHDGKLRYDDRLTDIFLDFPAYGRGITIRNLLNHTSGLLDYEELMQASAGKPSPWSKTNQIQDAEVLALLEQQSATKFLPGTKWDYSNSGYVLLGLVVAKVSGQSFGEFLRQRVFQPLGMRHTLAYARGKNEVPNRAYGYSREPAGWKETDQSPTSATLGDGGVYSSLEDLAKWDEALAQHTLLSETELRAALTPVALPDGSVPVSQGKPVRYGFGWYLDPYQSYARMWHGGSTMGFRTNIQRFVDDKLTIIVLCNRADLDPSALALKVADVLVQ